eukprot:TRINITY_DN68988_c0_g1_i1.p1 TRINITY_DN68988_c0_g1~~TRINITY_DN68988_c0_g1_i1.p1  ORF type:complete len:516 (+),score=67.89 TRINITY_DN68988_c0_g1_i1:43-1590(+)
MSKRQVAVVGGGIAGVATTVHILKRPDADAVVHIFERSPEIGPGLAWTAATADDCQLSNAPAMILQILMNVSPPNFGEWAQKKYPDTIGKEGKFPWSYPPRKYFGEYLVDLWATIVKEYPNSIVVHAQTEVTSVAPTTTGDKTTFKVTYQESKEGSSTEGSITVDKVALCVGGAGTGANVQLPGSGPGYIPSPWPCKVLDNIPEPKKIALVGTGLTGVDVVKYLARKYPKADLLMTSRQGRFNVVAANYEVPKVGQQGLYTPKVLTPGAIQALPTPAPLDKLIAMVKEEICMCFKEVKKEEADIPWDKILSDDVDGIAELRQHVQNHKDGRLCRWTFLMFFIAEHFHMLWQKLSADDKDRWMKSNMKTVFQNHSNPFPVESADEILQLVDSKRLTVRSKFKDFTENDDKTITVNFTSGESVQVDCVVNCTGINVDVTTSKSPLLQQLVKDGLATPDQFGGFVLDPATMRAIQPEGKQPLPIFVVGNLAKGCRYITSHLGNVMAMAGMAANFILTQ